MATSRRVFVTTLFGAAATACLGQGVAPHKGAVQPRGKPSGLPFNAHFTDVAAKAGLQAITVYGESDRKEYIVETLGCGCAFLDFDNDGWLDVFLLSGSQTSQTLPRAPVIASTKIIAMAAFTRCHRAGGTFRSQVGPAAFALATTTTTVLTICSSPTGDKMFSIATTATELSVM